MKKLEKFTLPYTEKELLQMKKELQAEQKKELDAVRKKYKAQFEELNWAIDAAKKFSKSKKKQLAKMISSKEESKTGEQSPEQNSLADTAECQPSNEENKVADDSVQSAKSKHKNKENSLSENESSNNQELPEQVGEKLSNEQSLNQDEPASNYDSVPSAFPTDEDSAKIANELFEHAPNDSE